MVFGCRNIVVVIIVLSVHFCTIPCSSASWFPTIPWKMDKSSQLEIVSSSTEHIPSPGSIQSSSSSSARPSSSSKSSVDSAVKSNANGPSKSPLPVSTVVKSSTSPSSGSKASSLFGSSNSYASSSAPKQEFSSTKMKDSSSNNLHKKAGSHYGDEVVDPFLNDHDIMNVLEENYVFVPTKKGSSSKGSGSASDYIISRTARKPQSRTGILKHLPKINFHLDPVINYKFKQRINLLGAAVTLGMDYLSDITQWRAFCSVEDNIIGGRFSLRGSELGWTKSWISNLGLMDNSVVKFKLRAGLNLKTYTAYARLRFRTEPISPFDLGDGISCAGKLPLTLLLPGLRDLPLRVEYRVRISTNQPRLSFIRNQREGKISLSTGIDEVDLSLDELNFCLEWDERSPVWGIGIVRSDRFMPNLSSLTKRITMRF